MVILGNLSFLDLHTEFYVKFSVSSSTMLEIIVTLPNGFS